MSAVAERTDTRSRIVAAAVTLFAQQGFDATSVNQVVARAGVAKGALYHHFDSKDDLLYEVYRELVDRQLAGLAEVVAKQLAPADTLRAIIVDMVATTAARASEAKVFFRESHRLGDVNQQRVRASRRQIHDAVTGLVRQAQQDGRFSTVASPEMVTFTVFGVINELPVWYSPDGPLAPEEIAEQLSNLVLAGLNLSDASSRERSSQPPLRSGPSDASSRERSARSPLRSGPIKGTNK